MGSKTIAVWCCVAIGMVAVGLSVHERWFKKPAPQPVKIAEGTVPSEAETVVLTEIAEVYKQSIKDCSLFPGDGGCIRIQFDRNYHYYVLKENQTSGPPGALGRSQ